MLSMKKIILLFLTILVAASLFTSCAPSRKGCPTTNPRYFKY